MTLFFKGGITMSKRFIMIFFSLFIILCFQGAYAEQETENKFESVLNCFRVLYGKIYYDPDRRFSGYLEKANIVVLPHPLNSHKWLFVTADAIYQQLFWEKIGALNHIIGIDGLLKTFENHFELSLPNEQRIHVMFRYKQYFQGDPTKPALALSLVENESQTCDLPFCKTLTPNDTTDTDKEFVVDSLRNRIETVYKRFSELNYQNRPADGFISALNTCKGIDGGLDSIIAQEIEKF